MAILGIDDFKSKLTGGGARSTLYKATVNYPAFVGGDVELTSFLIKASKDSKIISNGQEILLEPKLNLPPIYIGQMAKVAFNRTIRFGQGWMPVSISPEELAPKVIELKNQAKIAGREKIEIIAMKTLPLDDIESAKKMAIAYKDAGATQLVHTQGYETVAHYQEIIEKLEKSIKPLI